MIHSRISGTGSYLPVKVLTNADLEKMVDTSSDWIVDRTGIRERHIAAADETTCDLAEQAARHAIQAAGLTNTDIDLIIVATTTPDRIFPSTACLLQDRLDIHGCAAFDIQAPYTTNLPLARAVEEDVLLVHTWEGAPLPQEHGGPCRMITPKLYAWKGTKWIRKIEFLAGNRLGFWEERGYSDTAEPWFDDRYS